jgi:hypothetical protein
MPRIDPRPLSKSQMQRDKRLTSDATERKSVAEHYAEIAELGATENGEGEIN